jgi:hypothetical protein
MKSLRMTARITGMSSLAEHRHEPAVDFILGARIWTFGVSLSHVRSFLLDEFLTEFGLFC